MQKLFYNGSILTMEKETSNVNAILIEDGKIKKVGDKKEILKESQKNVEVIDLKGKCLMPAFIDAHSHISAFTRNSKFC